MHSFQRAGAVIAIGLIASTMTVVSAEAHDYGIHDNCTKFNNRFPHGVGTRYARDKTSGTLQCRPGPPVARGRAVRRPACV